MAEAKKTILVVGGAGYICSRMDRVLLERGYGVITLDNLSTGFRRLVTGGEFVEGCLGDSKVLDEIQAVMHFGAFSLVGEVDAGRIES